MGEEESVAEGMPVHSWSDGAGAAERVPRDKFLIHRQAP
jgi:hypothetical protein